MGSAKRPPEFSLTAPSSRWSPRPSRFICCAIPCCISSANRVLCNLIYSRTISPSIPIQPFLSPYPHLVSCPPVWYLTKEDSQKWCEGHGFSSGRDGYPVIDDKKHSAVTYFSEKNWS